MQNNLDEIWELLDMNNHKPSKEEKKVMSELEILENRLLISLSDDQKDLLLSLTNTISDLSYLERKEAFIKGVKFATQYLLEATDLI